MEVLKAVERLEKQKLSEFPQTGQLPGVIDYTTDILIYRLLEIYDNMVRARDIETYSIANIQDSARKSSMIRKASFQVDTQNPSGTHDVIRKKWLKGLDLLKDRGNRLSRDSFDQRGSLPRYTDPVNKVGVIMALNKMSKSVGLHVRRQRLAYPPIQEAHPPIQETGLRTSRDSHPDK